MNSPLRSSFFRILACALGLHHAALAQSPDYTGFFGTPVTQSLLDPAAFVEWVDGAERPVDQKGSRNPGPHGAIITQTSLPFFVGVHKFGDTKTPGPRHLRIGFTEALPVGTLLAQGKASVAVLKPEASYPGDLADDSQWIPAERVDSNSDTGITAWLLPPGTKTRALRFTHVAQPLDNDFSGSLRGVQLLEGRFANIAPLAIAAGRASKGVAKINNDEHDGWFAWENIGSKDPQRARTIADDPEWLILSWPEPVQVRGSSLVWAGFGAGEIQTYAGPASTAPADASEKDWQPLVSLPDVRHRYPTTFAPHWIDFGKDVTTRALRLRITAVSGESSVKDRHRDGRRVWLGEWLVFASVNNLPLASMREAFDKRRAAPEKTGAIPVRFSIPEDGFVTLVIEDSSGFRVRNLVSETPFKAGENTVWWDGSDDLGRDAKAAQSGVYHIPYQPVAPGEYRVRGLWRKDVVPNYEFSVYARGNPPWGNGTGGWIANHSAPQAAVFVPGGPRSPTGEPLVYLGCLVTEGPDAVAWVDLDGKKRGGRKWIGGTWTGAPFMTHDAGAKADPAVSVYVGTGWKDDKVADSSLLRLNTLTPSGESKHVLNVDLGKLVPGTKMSDSLGGLAARDGVLVCSLTHLNELLFVNAAPDAKAAVTGRIPLNSPRGSAFDSQGRFFVLSGKTLVRFPGFPSADAKPDTLVSRGLEDPHGLAIDADGNLYVSDWGASHQVKVFAPSGKFLRAIGVAGEPKTGPYDRNHMNHPWGLAIDSQNRLWVAEKDQLPRRVSVWSLDGKLRDAFYGPGKYGGGGVVDPSDKTRFYYAQESSGAMEFRLDWEKGTSELVSVYYRRDEDDAMKLPKGTAAPETAFHFKGRRYFANTYNTNPTSGAANVFLFEDREGVARPVAGVGVTREWDVLYGDDFRPRWPSGWSPVNAKGNRQSVFFLWQDLNDDAQVQPDEVDLLAIDARGVTLMPDLSFYVANFDGHFPAADGTTKRFAPVGFNERGNPRYDLAKAETIIENVRFGVSSGGSQTLSDGSGWTVLTLGAGPFDARSVSGAKDGRPLWSYPSLWPGLHAGQGAPRHSFPGQIIGTTRLLGGFFKVGDETLWAVNADQGGPYVFTRDGLFVATLFDDVRDGKHWRMPIARRGMSLKGVTLGQENFWPTIGATADNQVLMVDGARCAIVRIDGLDTIRRLDAGKITVTADDIVRSQEILQNREVARQRQLGSGVLKVAITATPPVIDGKLDDWKLADWVEIDRRGRQNVRAAVSLSSDRLFAAWQTGEANLLNNTGENPAFLFKTGGALDLMIGTDPVADPNRKKAVPGDLRLLVTQVPGPADAKGRVTKFHTKAMLYRAVVPGTADSAKVPFGSPIRTIHFDLVSDVSDNVILATDKKGGFELSVPLDTLGLSPVRGVRVRGDIGILRGNGAGETTARVYWSNKSTAIVSDVPSEAELAPALWGPWEIGSGG